MNVYESIGILPLRKDSKGIPGKNIKPFLGKPLYEWALDAMIASNLSVIVVATRIPLIINSPRVQKLKRSKESDADDAPTEIVMEEVIDAFRPGENTKVILCQATSPYTTSDDINAALDGLDYYDSVLSAVPHDRFAWSRNRFYDTADPVNYDPIDRPFRHDIDPFYIENGALYGSTVDAIKTTGCRISGKIGILEQERGFELDEPQDWKKGEEICSNLITT